MAKKRTSKPGATDGIEVSVIRFPSGFPEPMGPQQLHDAAKVALKMLKKVAQYLPIEGERGLKSDINVIDDWFQSAGEDYTTFERLRNSERLPWRAGPGSYHVETPSSTAVVYYQELCRAMVRVCEAYQWQGISDGSRIPHSMQRFGTALIPKIDAGVLHAVAVAGQGLLEELDPADIDGRQLIAKLTPQPPIGAVREFSPWIDSPKMIELMKLNGIRGTSDTAIKRSKKLWQAEPQVGRHNQLFHFRLATLRELRIKYPPEWDNPPN